MGGSNGTVVALHLCEEHHRPPSPRDEIRAVVGYGLEGDVHAGRDGREVLLAHVGDLGDVGLRPGDLREQVTVDLPGLMTLTPGSRLTVGDAVLEVSKACAPCTHIGEELGKEDIEAFRSALVGRRGMLAMVVEVTGEGAIRRGDPVTVTAPVSVAE